MGDTFATQENNPQVSLIIFKVCHLKQQAVEALLQEENTSGTLLKSSVWPLDSAQEISRWSLASW